MSEPAEIFKAQQGDRLLKVTFKDPIFSLFADFPALCQEVYPRLQAFGLRLGGMRLESTGGDLGEVHLRCEIPGSVTVRLWIDRFETWSDLLQLPRIRHAELVDHLLEGLVSHQPSLQSFEADLQIHGSLRSKTPHEFLKTWGGLVPENLGPHLGSGVVFYFGPHGNRAVSSVTLDNSARIQGGLFIRTRTVGDASTLRGHELGEVADSFFADVMREVGFTTEETRS